MAASLMSCTKAKSRVSAPASTATMPAGGGGAVKTGSAGAPTPVWMSVMYPVQAFGKGRTAASQRPSTWWSQPVSAMFWVRPSRFNWSVEA